jgi:hypothetical protein
MTQAQMSGVRVISQFVLPLFVIVAGISCGGGEGNISRLGLWEGL